MTQQEAKKELRQLKESGQEIKNIDLEIERLVAVATRMTTAYEPRTSSSYSNRLEEAVIQIEDYRSKLSDLLVEELAYRNKCMSKVQQIKTKTLRMVLIYYYFMDNTMEKTAELMNKSYQWTYSMFQSALDEYCKISEKNSIT